MHSLVFLGLLGAVCATNFNLTQNVGGSDPPITSPQVMSEKSFNGPYQQVIILSVDGLHAVIALDPFAKKDRSIDLREHEAKVEFRHSAREFSQLRQREMFDAQRLISWHSSTLYGGSPTYPRVMV